MGDSGKYERSAHVLLYDRDCGLCRTIVAAALRLDGADTLHPRALQDPATARLLPGMSEQQRMASFHLLDERTGEVASAGAGLTALASALPATRPFGRLLRATPRLTERGYRLVAQNRDRIGPLIPAAVKASATRRITNAEARDRGEPV